MKTVEQRSPVQYSPRRQSMWVLADYGGKDLWKRWGLSLEWNSECVMEGEKSSRTAVEHKSPESWVEAVTTVDWRVVWFCTRLSDKYCEEWRGGVWGGAVASPVGGYVWAKPY